MWQVEITIEKAMAEYRYEDNVVTHGGYSCAAGKLACYGEAFGTMVWSPNDLGHTCNRRHAEIYQGPGLYYKSKHAGNDVVLIRNNTQGQAAGETTNKMG